MKSNASLGFLLIIASAVIPAMALSFTETGISGSESADQVPARARALADTAVAKYGEAQIELLAEMVRFRTVHEEGLPNADNPEFKAFKKFLHEKAEEFGLEFADHGAVAVISLDNDEDKTEERLGIVTHGDVQPADASKWRKSPFILDTESEPGRMIARGTEDDKAAIATAMYAMKTLKEQGVELKKRIELIVALTEESDWAPFEEFLANNPPPEMNIGIDASYPVVVAEKGWGFVKIRFDADAPAEAAGSESAGVNVRKYSGGAFISQVPEDAIIRIVDASDALEARIRERASADDSGVQHEIQRENSELVIRSRGKAAHSSEPESGLNALAHAAALLKGEDLLDNSAGRAIGMINSLLGTDFYGKQFGDAAYSHSFMGPLTLNLSTVRQENGATEVAINSRAPAGKTAKQLEKDLREAILGWAGNAELPGPELEFTLSEPYYPERAPQVEPLLSVFRHYANAPDAQPISIGGGTNARLLPNAVNFGPSMPDRPYSGHSEHEFITREQMLLNLKMYTAMLAWLAGEPETK